jgi:hypothetical protein
VNHTGPILTVSLALHALGMCIRLISAHRRPPSVLAQILVFTDRRFAAHPRARSQVGVSANLLYGFGHINLQKPGIDSLLFDSAVDGGVLPCMTPAVESDRRQRTPSRSVGLDCGAPAVGGNDHAGHEAGVGGRQEYRDLGNFCGVGGALQRGGGPERLEELARLRSRVYGPAATVSTLTPWRLNSAAHPCANDARAALVAPYAAAPARPRLPAMLPLLMMLPWPCAAIPGANAATR